MNQVEPIVTEGAKLKARIKADSERLKEISERLVAEGAGEYHGAEGVKAIVVVPGPSLKPAAETIDALKTTLGDSFGKLFDRVVSYKPVKSFREVAGALMTKAKATRLIVQCEVAATPFVKWS